HHADHGADEGVHEHEQRELRGVLAQAELHARHDRRWRCGAHARLLGARLPRLSARISSISAGFGCTCASASTNACFGSESIGLKRFSNAIVLEALPLMPAPHDEPEKWPG